MYLKSIQPANQFSFMFVSEQKVAGVTVSPFVRSIICEARWHHFLMTTLCFYQSPHTSLSTCPSYPFIAGTDTHRPAKSRVAKLSFITCSGIKLFWRQQSSSHVPLRFSVFPVSLSVCLWVYVLLMPWLSLLWLLDPWLPAHLPL